LEVVHEGFVLELTVEPTWVTDAIPRFDADEGGFFAIRAPESHNGRAEFDSHFGFSILP
jgi:hypothetical protein